MVDLNRRARQVDNKLVHELEGETGVIEPRDRDGQRLAGGQVVQADAPISQIPVYVRGDHPDLMRHFGDLYSE